MDAYRNKGIKDIIVEFPEVGEILSEYGIECVSCSVGICALKDILDIHAMVPEKEKELMARIEATIYPERDIEFDAVTVKSSEEVDKHEFSQPMQILVDEHTLIKRWLALVPWLLDNIDATTPEGQRIFRAGVDFIKSYADRLHHGKEEDILFTYFDNTEAIFQVIYEDHRIARRHVKQMLVSLDKKDADSLREHLLAYTALLRGHINKEDEILFPWLDRSLTSEQIAELDNKFAGADQNLAVDTEKYRAFVEGLEARLQN